MDRIDRNSHVLIALAFVEELSLKKKESLKNAFASPACLAEEKNRKTAQSILDEGHYNDFISNLGSIDKILSALKERNVHWITYLDDEYPRLLGEIDNSPLILFAKGDVSLLNSGRTIAVVGTRRPTRYGSKAADSFTREFARAGLTVVSGFARGVDGIAHKACVESDSPTIAVFANGLDRCYPPEHKGLAERILASGGLLISEYGLGVKPYHYHFPERNRIISGLSEALFLPEAALKSGSLITARYALEQNREVFVLPGNIDSPASEGCNRLLSEIPHAFTISPDNVLEFYGLNAAPRKRETVELSITENLVTETLKKGEMHFEQLLEITGIGVSELGSILINLELNGIVEHTDGNHYVLA